jgi:hypothetical protein
MAVHPVCGKGASAYIAVPAHGANHGLRPIILHEPRFNFRPLVDVSCHSSRRYLPCILEFIHPSFH